MLSRTCCLRSLPRLLHQAMPMRPNHRKHLVISYKSLSSTGTPPSRIPFDTGLRLPPCLVRSQTIPKAKKLLSRSILVSNVLGGLSIQLFSSFKDEDGLDLLNSICYRLMGASRSEADVRVLIGFMTFLATWMYDFPKAVKQFLSEGANFSFVCCCKSMKIAD